MKLGSITQIEDFLILHLFILSIFTIITTLLLGSFFQKSMHAHADVAHTH